QRAATAPARAARAAARQEVDADLLADRRRAGQTGHALARFDDSTGHLVSGSDRVDPLVADEEPALHRAEPARADLHQELIGADDGPRLVAQLDGTGTGDHGDLHVALPPPRGITRPKRGATGAGPRSPRVREARHEPLRPRRRSSARPP